LDNEAFSPQELERYARNLSLPQFGQQAQAKIKGSAVLIVGLGGLGSTSATYMTAAGVGQIGLLDNDIIRLSNLPRQVLYNTEELGEPKVRVAKKRLLERNPEVVFQDYQLRLDQTNAHEIISHYDLVLDGTDNLWTRKIINQTCVNLDKPYIYGGASLYDGQVSVFWAKHGPCFSCLFPSIETETSTPDESPLGVLSTLPGIVSTIQSTEALKLITGIGTPLIGQLLMIDGLNGVFHRIEIKKRDSCPICGKGKPK